MNASVGEGHGGLFLDLEPGDKSNSRLLENAPNIVLCVGDDGFSLRWPLSVLCLLKREHKCIKCQMKL